MTKRGKVHRKRTYWTRERVIAGLRLFYEDFGFTPVSMEAFGERTAFTGRSPEGEYSAMPNHRRYPSAGPIGKYFKSMREAWTAAGFDVDKGYLEWSEMEDWFVIESCGVLPREEVAELLGRTVPAVKRRLYDLGRFTAYTRWGITLSRAAHLMGIFEQTIRRHIYHGKIPVFKGYKLIYLNPADLLEIKEVNWNEVPEELEQMIRKALAQRIAKIIKYGPSWREYEIYKFAPKQFSGRVKNFRKPAMLRVDVPDKPEDINVGDWITTKQTILGRKGRVGRVVAVHYSPSISGRRDGTKRAAWIARIDFPRLRRSSARNANEKRIRYSLPLDTLEKREAPEISTPELNMHPEAVRGRKRREQYVVRAQSNFEKIRSEVSL